MSEILLLPKAQTKEPSKPFICRLGLDYGANPDPDSRPVIKATNKSGTLSVAFPVSKMLSDKLQGKSEAYFICRIWSGMLVFDGESDPW